MPRQNPRMDHLPFLQAALNGDRVHPATPHSPEEIAAEAKAAVAAGAQSVHLHPYGLDGRQTLDAAVCAETIRRVRQACPRTTISLTTSADVVEDPVERFRLIAAWTVLPDLVTANQGEEGILYEAGIALEQVHHGDGIASWAVNERAIRYGHGIRTGLEDTPVLPDGSQAQENCDLVAAAAAMQRGLDPSCSARTRQVG